VIDEVLRLRPAAGMRLFSERVAAEHPDAGVVEGAAWGFDPFAYAASGACAIEPLATEHVQLGTAWDGSRGIDHPTNGAFAVRWNDTVLQLYWITFGDNAGSYFALVTPQRADAMRFF
jgi:hypothetical protein